MGSRIRDGLDIGAAPEHPFTESDYRTLRIAADIMEKVRVEERATLLRAIRLQHDDFVDRDIWQQLEVVARGWQSGRKITLFLHADEPSRTFRLTGEIEDPDKGWIIHEAGLTLREMPLAWSNGIRVGGLLSGYVDIDILGERIIEGIENEGDLTRIRLSGSPAVAGIPHVAEMF